MGHPKKPRTETDSANNSARPIPITRSKTLHKRLFALLITTSLFFQIPTVAEATPPQPPDKTSRILSNPREHLPPVEPPVRSQSRRVIPTDPAKRCPRFEPLFRQHGLPVVAFSYISWRESRCSPKAHNKTLNRNGSQDYGLVQINSGWKTITAQICQAPFGQMTILFDVDCNLKVARYLYDRGGLGHWRIRTVDHRD